MTHAAPKGLGALTESLIQMLRTGHVALRGAPLHAALAQLATGAEDDDRDEAARAFVAAARQRLAAASPPLTSMEIANAVGLVAQEIERLEVAGDRALTMPPPVPTEPEREVRDDRWRYEQSWLPRRARLTLRFEDAEQLARFCEMLVRERAFECRIDTPPPEFAAIEMDVGVLGEADGISVGAGVVEVRGPRVRCAVQHVPAGVRRTAARRRARLSGAARRGANVHGHTAPPVQPIRSDFADVPTGGHKPARDRKSALRRRGRTRTHTPAARPARRVEDELTRFGRERLVLAGPGPDDVLVDTTATPRATDPPLGSAHTPALSPALAARAAQAALAPVAFGPIVSRDGGGPLPGGLPAVLVRAATAFPMASLEVLTETGRWEAAFAGDALLSVRDAEEAAPAALPTDRAGDALARLLGRDLYAWELRGHGAAAVPRGASVLPYLWAWLRRRCDALSDSSARAALGARLSDRGCLCVPSTVSLDELEPDPAWRAAAATLVGDRALETILNESDPGMLRVVATLDAAGFIAWTTAESGLERVARAWPWIIEKADDPFAANPYDLLEAHWAADGALVRHAAERVARALDLDFVAVHGDDRQRVIARRLRAAIFDVAERLQNPVTRARCRADLVDDAQAAVELQTFRAQAEVGLVGADVRLAIDSLRRVVELAPMDSRARDQLEALIARDAT